MKSDNVLVMKFPNPHQDPKLYGANSTFVKLCDFGTSQLGVAQGTRGLIGTPGFVAPEILRYFGKEVQDITSLLLQIVLFLSPLSLEVHN